MLGSNAEKKVRQNTASTQNESLQVALDAVGQVILGKSTEIRLAFAALLARGHLLIEDVPGVGKTTLANAVARSAGLQFNRVQFTSDLLPADILGASIYNKENESFEFHPGPIFTQVLLADEINRATPRTQSALLEAMAEMQVSQEGITRPLPKPFFVIATQNPLAQMGTYPLPESQLDRFLLCIQLGYPQRNAERDLLLGKERKDLLATMAAVLDADIFLQMQEQVSQMHVAPALHEYILDILHFSRKSGLFVEGLSPRAGLALLQCARAWGFLHAASYVTPDHVQAVLPGVVRHRLMLTRGEGETAQTGDSTRQAADILLQQVNVP